MSYLKMDAANCKCLIISRHTVKCCCFDELSMFITCIHNNNNSENHWVITDETNLSTKHYYNV